MTDPLARVECAGCRDKLKSTPEDRAAVLGWHLDMQPDHAALSLEHLDNANAISNQQLKGEQLTLSLIHAIHADIASRTLHTRTNNGDWAGMDDTK